jgi:hypothetical protein
MRVANETDFGGSIKCADCGATVGKYEIFPGDRCLSCHAIEFDKHPMPTAQDIRQMWGM